MKREPHHIIHRLLLEVETNRKSTGMAVKDNIQDILEKELLPLIENHLDEMENELKGQHFQIPRIDFQLTSHPKLFEGTDSAHDPLVMAQITGQLKEQLEQKLQQIKLGLIATPHFKAQRGKEPLNLSQREEIGQNENLMGLPLENIEGGLKELVGDEYKNLSELDREIITLITILKSGQKPWWVGNNEKQRFFTSWASSESIKDILNAPLFGKLFLENVPSLSFKNRLIRQFSNVQLNLIFDALVHYHFDLTKIQKNEIPEIIQSNELLKEAYWKFVFGIFDKDWFKANFRKDLDIIFKKASQSSSITNVELRDNILALLDLAGSIHSERFHWLPEHPENAQIPPINITENQDAREIVQNHLDHQENSLEEEPSSSEIVNEPFHIAQAGLVLLHPFLKAFFQKTELLDADNQIQVPEYAAHLLHYVATKEEKAFDHEMLFEKYCCNIPLDKAMVRDVEISSQHKMMAEELLEAVRDHWKALKNTGIDTLRAEFLCRMGKLDLDGDHPKLHLERKTQDILLDQLPWNISMVKFPWKKELLFVEW